MSNLTRIVAMVVDTRNMTMYKQDGTTIVIPQGDPRLRKIVDDAGPLLALNGWADVDLSNPDDTTYMDFQTRTNGIIQFFRVAKAKLTELLKISEDIEQNIVAETVIGTVPANDDQAETFEPVVPVVSPKVEQSMAAVNEIIANATPVSSPKFHEVGIEQQRVLAENGVTPNDHPEDRAEDTIVAVIDGKVIPGMERIKSQFAHAFKMGSTQGVERFLKRLSTVIEHRSHSVEDLLKFMERADLPIADDGSILIYKVLRRSGDKYVDCHTRNVEQWVGAYVCMDPKLVDHNRNNECSNGLHVARRGYIRQFSGDVCVLAKLAPEDVITVPKYDANKMRVCGYHILFELTPVQYGLLKQNKPITDNPEGKLLLGRAMAGDHVHKTHEVRITSQHGGGVITTKLKSDTRPVLAPVETKPMEAIGDKQEVRDAPMDLKTVNAVVEQTLSRRDQAQALYAEWANKAGTDGEEWAFNELTAFKRTAKVSWDKLGIPTKDGQPVLSKKGKAKPVVQSKSQAKRVTTQIAVSDGSPRERIAKLMEIGLDTTGVAQKILDIKKAAKKNWQVLGVNEKQMKKILKLTGNG